MSLGAAATLRVGSPEVGWSEVFNFSSAPEAAAVAQGQDSLTFLVFNDVGQENSGRQDVLVTRRVTRTANQQQLQG
jgi:hypothetical protein